MMRSPRRSFTAAAQGGVDQYNLTLVDGGYRRDGAVRPFETSVRVRKVKQPGGQLTDDTLHVRRSIHGPLVGEKAGKAHSSSPLWTRLVPCISPRLCAT